MDDDHFPASKTDDNIDEPGGPVDPEDPGPIDPAPEDPDPGA